MTKKRPLTARQKRFCDEWLLCMNGAEAARRAGYSEKVANRIATENLSKPVIRAYIDERKQAEEELLGFSRFTQIADLIEIKKRCLQQVKMKSLMNPAQALTGEAPPEMEFEFDARAAISAITEMNRMMGYHAPEKHDLTSKGEQLQPIVGMIIK